jgi:hypothetical protein
MLFASLIVGLRLQVTPAALPDEVHSTEHCRQLTKSLTHQLTNATTQN